jgi:hypothetical protein
VGCVWSDLGWQDLEHALALWEQLFPSSQIMADLSEFMTVRRPRCDVC